MLTGLVVAPAHAYGDHTNWAFGFTAYTNGLAYTHASQYHNKEDYENFIEVRHHVVGNGSSAGYTNLMCGYLAYDQIYAGEKWQAPNDIYYKCTSNLLTMDELVTPGGRGNTKYKEFLNLDSVQLEGQFRTH